MNTEGGSAGLQDSKEPGEPDPALFDTGVAHPARVYNYWLGGKDNYAADREAAGALLAPCPGRSTLTTRCDPRK